MPQRLPEEEDGTELRRVRRGILVADLVESVRLMQLDEASTVASWRRLVLMVRERLLVAHQGRLVKSLGDGLLLEFPAARQAVAAAFDLRKLVAEQTPALQLRIGVHESELVVDELDVYGTGVNLAARLAGVARPGDIVVSAACRDRCIDGLDGEFEDLGEVYLKHLQGGVHAVRARPLRGGVAQARSTEGSAELETLPDSLPRVAVLPWLALPASDEEAPLLAELVADAVVARLAASTQLHTVSRLSSSALQGRALDVRTIGRLLGVDYLLTGRCILLGARLVISAELCEAREARVLWSERWSCDRQAPLQPDDAMSAELAQRVAASVADRELRRSLVEPLPTLRSCSLQLAGIGLMYRSPTPEFERAGEVFEALIERHPRAATPRAHRAQWHVLRVTRGLASDTDEEARQALEHTRCALQSDPEHALALAVEGFVHCHISRDLDEAERRIEQALAAKPSEPLAWLFRCTVQGFRGDGEAAWASAKQALALSPLDPMRGYFDGLAASAALVAGCLQDVLQLGERALRANRHHLPTLRALVIAHVELGDLQQARLYAKRVMVLEPGFTLSTYQARAPRGSGGALRERYVAALAAAGIPM